MRQATLFYTFLALFVVTAILTLLGVIQVLAIPEKQLYMLLSAFLIETAGAVVALYRRTDFFADAENNLASSLGGSFEAFDRIADEIKAAITKKPTDPDQVHSYLIRKTNNGLVGYQKMRVVTSAELEKLPKGQRDMIRTYKRSMDRLLKEWMKLKNSGAVQLEPAMQEKQIALLKGMKNDLTGLIDFLQTMEIYLPDHYMEVRNLVAGL